MSEFSPLLGPTLICENSKGEVFFSLKRKGEKYGQLYYLFEMHEEKIDPDKKKLWDIAWGITKIAAARMEIPLYDKEEVTVKINQILKRMEKPKGRFDVEITVTDHATGETQKLTVGVTAKKSDESC